MFARIPALLTICLAVAAAAPAQDAPLAVLMAQQGEVLVQRGDEALAGQFGMHLDQGDEIRTGAESRADILFSTGQALQLGANGSLVVQAAEGAGSSPVFASADRLLKLRDKRGTSVIGRVRGDNDAEIIAVSPRRAARVQARPVFEWSGGTGELELTLEHEGEVVWQATVSGESFAYPDDAPALEPGRTYAWRVRTADPLAMTPAESQTAFFETLSPGEETALDETLAALEKTPVESSSRAVMKASVLFDHGLVGEAIATLDAAIEDAPEVAEGLAAVRDDLRAASWP